MASTLGTTGRTRREMAGELVALIPQLKRRFQATLPAQLNEKLGPATTHQLEALHLLHLTVAAADDRTGATMNELARRQGCALSTATALADRLLRQGLAERIQDTADRRVVRIAPTVKGEELCARFAEVRRDLALRAVAALSDEEMATLIGLMRKVAAVEEVVDD